MAVPAQLVAVAVGDGYLRIGFKQDGEWMKTDSNGEDACVTLQYPRHAFFRTGPHQPTETDDKARAMNSYLKYPNELLKEWCS